MMQKKWLALLLAQLVIVLYLTSYVNKYGAVGWLCLGLVFIIMPYTLYRTLPVHHLSMLLAISIPVLLGLAWGKWLGFYENYQLGTVGLRTKGIGTATWVTRTRRGGKEKPFQVKFKINDDYREVFSHKNEANYQVGDSLLVDYIPSEPNTYRIIR